MIYFLILVGCVSSIHSRNNTNVTEYDDFLSHLPELDEATMAFQLDQYAGDDFFAQRSSNSKRKAPSSRRRRRTLDINTNTIEDSELDEPG